MSNKDLLDEILNLRKEYIAKTDENNEELSNLYEQLLKWEQQIINELDKFIQEKFNEIKQKYFEINRQQIRDLDILYSNCLSNNNNNDHNYSQLFENFNKLHSSIKIIYPKQIDFNQYLQLNTDHLNDIHRSLLLINNKNHFNLSSYQFYSTLSIQSNITSLFSTDDHLLVYYDHHTSSASLHIFDLKNYLEQTNNNNRSYLKFRVPCKQFQGKILHIDYCLYLQGFLLATCSKLFTLQISNTYTHHYVTEHFDIMNRKFPGIIQKFACHPTSLNIIYLLVNAFSQFILVQIDLSKNFRVRNKWDYPKDDIYKNVLLTTTDNNITKFNSQLTAINDFALGKDIFIFAVTYQINDNSSYQFHIRSTDMHLQHSFLLNTTFSPLHICIIPCDYSSSLWNQQEQFIIISEKSKNLSLYDFNPINDNDKIQLIDEIILDTEPEYIGFVNNNLSILLIRNVFHIAIYKHINNNNTNISLPIHQRLSPLCRTDSYLS